MGCGTSRPRASPSTATPSVRAISHSDPSSAAAAHPSASTLTTTTPSPALALHEQFNQPLRAHVWRTTAPRRASSTRIESDGAVSDAPLLRTKSAIDAAREEFFHTRVTNRPEVWSSLQAAIALLDEGDVVTAQGVVDAAGVTVPTGDLVDGVYDAMGNFYALPQEVVAYPVDMLVVRGEEEKGRDGGETLVDKDGDDGDGDGDAGVGKVEKGKEAVRKEAVKQGEGFRVRARLSDRSQDVVVSVGKEDPVKLLVQRVEEKAGVPEGKVKVAYMGKILEPAKPLLAQGWKEGHLVNALVFS